MLNQSGITTTKGFNTDQILASTKLQYSIPIIVSSTGVQEVNGKKIVKAGSLLTKDGKVANDKTVRYVLLKDIDVTYGKAAGTGVYRGTLDKKKIEKNTGVTISEDAMLALKGIIFMTEDNLDYFADVKAAPGA